MKDKLHLGCGPHSLLEGWLNVDLRSFPGIDETLDATKPWPYIDQFKFVYAEHFLEHLTLDGALSFFEHANKALRRNGILRLTTPSLEWVLKTHFTFPGEAQEIADQTLTINRAFHGWGHQFLWSKEFLTQALGAYGFTDVAFLGYGESGHQELVGIENHGGFSRHAEFPSVWILEACASRTEVDHSFKARCEQSFLRHVRSGH